MRFIVVSSFDFQFVEYMWLSDDTVTAYILNKYKVKFLFLILFFSLYKTIITKQMKKKKKHKRKKNSTEH